MAFASCTQSFDDNLWPCSVNDTTFINNTSGEKGGAIAVSSDSSRSTIEFHHCLIFNSTTGAPINDDPQGEGGAFVLGGGTHLILEDCVVKNNACGKKVWIVFDVVQINLEIGGREGGCDIPSVCYLLGGVLKKRSIERFPNRQIFVLRLLCALSPVCHPVACFRWGSRGL